MNITYVNTFTVEEYNLLRASAGWRTIHPEQAKAGIEGSAFITAATDGLKTIGVARLIWDGGYSALIKDVLVLPDYQGKGIGKEMVNRILGFLESKLKPGYKISVDLIAAKGKEGFYKQFGFSELPSEHKGPGMELKLTNENRMKGK